MFQEGIVIIKLLYVTDRHRGTCTVTNSTALFLCFFIFECKIHTCCVFKKLNQQVLLKPRPLKEKTVAFALLWSKPDPYRAEIFIGLGKRGKRELFYVARVKKKSNAAPEPSGQVERNLAESGTWEKPLSTATWQKLTGWGWNYSLLRQMRRTE